jgi:hypothetical protein
MPITIGLADGGHDILDAFGLHDDVGKPVRHQPIPDGGAPRFLVRFGIA